MISTIYFQLDAASPPHLPDNSTAINKDGIHAPTTELPTKEERSVDRNHDDDDTSTPPKRKPSPQSSPNVSTISGESIGVESSSPFRRSQRKRTATRRYSSHDFRPISDEEGEEEEVFVATPSSKRRKTRNAKSEKRVSFRSPLFSPRSAESAGDSDTGGSNLDAEFVSKQKELEELISTSLNSMRESKLASRQEAVKERMRLRDEARRKNLEEKQKIIEEKAKQREEEKLKKLATQEKLKLARNLLKEAQRDARKRQKEREKVRKQEELLLLKEKRQTERKMKQELTSAPVIRATNEVRVYGSCMYKYMYM